MIGVIAPASEHAVIAEFFELFKTPWEFYQDGRTYDVVLSTLDESIALCATKLSICYGARQFSIDVGEEMEFSSQGGNRTLLYEGSSIPIYGESITFQEKGAQPETDDGPRQAGMYMRHSNGRVIVRVGYELFKEVETLLTRGQPSAYASIPTLELHIGLLRDLILTSGAGLVEIPAIPAGYSFIACLTHDVDHPSIVKHKWDHTMFGFLYRAFVGSVRDFAFGRTQIQTLVRNWLAGIKLPFVYMGLAKDFWRDFADRYLELEKGLPSTFFVIPYANDPGRSSQGSAPRTRAAGYGAKDIKDVIDKITAAGCEVGLHGIDAWIDSVRGREEVAEIRHYTGASEIGVRMHWLYFEQQSPMALEDAGLSYDSTVGYRETIGYRSGTTQAYKPIPATRLLELPLHIMDTALFYPAYRNLSQRRAVPLLEQMVCNVAKFGGAVIINWHDRSLAPERNWESSYRQLVASLKSHGAWFATAGQACNWFRNRRSIVLQAYDGDPSEIKVNSAVEDRSTLPGLRLRVYKTKESDHVESHAPRHYFERTLVGAAAEPNLCGA
ncbi:MAG: hypothetical protein WCF30_11035 [Terracidiphilus sp.]